MTKFRMTYTHFDLVILRISVIGIFEHYLIIGAWNLVIIMATIRQNKF